MNVWKKHVAFAARIRTKLASLLRRQLCQARRWWEERGASSGQIADHAVMFPGACHLNFVSDRRVEDKLDAKGFTAARVNIRMQESHGNRRLPLLFTAWLAVSDAATKNIFQDSRMLVTE